MLTVDGSVSYDNSIISVSGTVSADIGSLSAPLLSGSFEIPLGQAGETDTAPGTLTDTSPSSSEEIAGLPIQITGLSLVPAARRVGPGNRGGGNISLLGTHLDATLLITDQGLQLEKGSFALPEISIPLGPLSVDATDVSVAYDAPNLVIQGELTLDNIIPGTTITADLTGNGKGILVNGSTFSLAGTLSLNDFTLPGGSGLTDCSLTFDTQKNDYSGAATLVIPDVLNLSVTFELLNGQLDSLGLTANQLEKSAWRYGMVP